MSAAPPLTAAPQLVVPAIETASTRWATTGDRACAWIERFLVHGEGDFYGRPFRLRTWQKAIIYRALEYDPVTMRRRFSRVLVGLPKGNGKTELIAALGLYLLLGDDPLSEGTPDVPVAAGSFEQADLLFGAAKTIVSHEACPLATFVDPFDTEILRKDVPGTLYRVAAAAGTNDGRKPSALLADELHEWTGKKVRVWIVLENGLAKRLNTLGIYITTAGVVGADSVAERLYQRALAIASGDVDDAGLLVVWYAAGDDLDLEDDDELLEAIMSANPAADDFWPAQRLVDKWRNREIPAYEFERYHLNRWTSADANPFLPPGRFSQLPKRNPPPDGANVWAYFDGSYNRDASAIWAAWRPDDPTDPVAVFRVGLWEKPATAGDEWRVDRRNVDAVIHKMMRQYNVVRLGVDPSGWHTEIDDWALAFGDVVVEVPSTQTKRWAEYCSRFYTAVVTGSLEHDHDGALARHLNNCVPRETAAGTYVRKESASSTKRIDAALAAIGAVGLALDHQPTPASAEVNIRWV